MHKASLGCYHSLFACFTYEILIFNLLVLILKKFKDYYVDLLLFFLVFKFGSFQMIKNEIKSHL
jgi:hypothetical protein